MFGAIVGVLMASVVSVPALPAVPAYAASISVELVAGGLRLPVAFEFAPGGRIVYVERRTGAVRIVDGSETSLLTTTAGPSP